MWAQVPVRARRQGSYACVVSGMRAGRAARWRAGIPAAGSGGMDLAGGRYVSLVRVDSKTMAELRKMNAGYHELTIKAGTYPKQDKDVRVIGYSTHLIASCDLPEDTVYKMTKAIAGHVEAMSSVVKPITGLTPKEMAVDIGIPMHKGALRVYREVGEI